MFFDTKKKIDDRDLDATLFIEFVEHSGVKSRLRKLRDKF